MRPSLARRLGVASLSLGVFLAAAWTLFGDRLSPPEAGGTVRIIDMRDEVDDLREQIRAMPPTEVDPILRDGVPWPGLAITPEKKVLLVRLLARQLEGHMVSDPDAYWVALPNFARSPSFAEHPAKAWISHTNSLGMKGRAEPAEEQPDLRILVTGDSHVEGVCRDWEAYPIQLGMQLRKRYPDKTIESFNAALGGYDMYHYLGVFEKFRWLKPDVFIVTVFGGNDFGGALGNRRFYTAGRRPPSDNQLRIRLMKRGIPLEGLNPQELVQDVLFLENPGDVQLAIEAMVAVTDRLQRLSEEDGIELICVYLPAPLRGQPQFYSELIGELEATLSEFEDPLASSDRIADGWLDFIEERGIRSLDLRPLFRACEEQLYWKADYHLNVRGQRFVAEALQPMIEQLLVEREERD